MSFRSRRPAQNRTTGRRRAQFWTALVAAGGFLGSTALLPTAAMPTAQAGDCQCQSCNSCQTASPGLIQKVPALKHKLSGKIHDSLVYKTLDCVAGGIEKVLGLDKCHTGQSSCDDGCDAATLEQWAVPMPPADSHPHSMESHSHSIPMPIHSAPMQAVPSFPSQSMGPHTSMPQATMPQTPMPQAPAPQTRMRMSEPTMSPTPQPQTIQAQPVQPPMQSERPLTDPVSSPQPNSVMPKSNESGPKLPAPPIPDDEADSLFDALSNPFGDDEVRVRRFQPVQPSNYEPELRPIRKHIISTDQSSSNRRTSSRR